MHLKFADFPNYVETMNARNAVTQATGANFKEAAIGRHWFADARGEDRATFEAFADLKMQEGFDLGFVRKKMQRTFKPRGETGFFVFDRPDYDMQYQLPERFNGLF